MTMRSGAQYLHLSGFPRPRNPIGVRICDFDESFPFGIFAVLGVCESRGMTSEGPTYQRASRDHPGVFLFLIRHVVS